MPKTLSLLAVLKKIDTKGIKSLSDPQWNTFLASDTEPNEIQEKIKKLEGYENTGAAYDATGELIVEDNNAMIERFRQRTGRARGRESLKVKKSKIDVKSFKEDFLNKKGTSVKADTTGTSDLALRKPSELPFAEEDTEDEETEGLKGIREVLDDILKVLRLDFKDDRKEARDNKKEENQQKREKKEDKLEGVGKSAALIGKSVQAMVKPFSKIWDSIIKFLQFTLIGVLFNKTLSWFNDPKNEKKARRVGKFFKDWWPALSAAALLFLTPFGSLVSGVVGLLTAIIPKIILAIAANPWAATAVLGGVAIWGLSKRIGKDNAQGEEQNSDSGISQQEMEAGFGETTSQSSTTGDGIAGSTTGDGIEGEQLQNQDETQNFKGGGLVQNFNEGGPVLGGFANVTNTETTSSFDSDGNFSFGKTFVSPEEAKEKLSVMKIPSMELMDGTVVPNFGKMGSDQIMQGVQAVREGMAQHPNKIKELDEFMATNPFAQPEKLQQMINRTVPGTQEQVMGDLGDDISAQAKPSNKVQQMNKGGKVPGSGNKDTVPAMLTPGEFVMSKGAVQQYGVDILASMNAAGGGSNIPSITLQKGSVQQFNQGGLVQYLANGGVVSDGKVLEVDTPIINSSSKVVTLPTIKKKGEDIIPSTVSDPIPTFRIPIVSSQRSMVLASLGIQDLIGE